MAVNKIYRLIFNSTCNVRRDNLCKIFFIFSVVNIALGAILLIYYETICDNLNYSIALIDEFPVYHFEKGSRSQVAADLFKTVRIYCWILTDETFHRARAIHVRATWAQHCNKFVFMSSVDDPDLPSVNLGVPKGRNFLWHKTKAALEYIGRNENLTDFDYFFKADDDTFAVLENMRLLLSPYSPNKAYYAGFKFHFNGGYMSGGAGYVLSRQALISLLHDGFARGICTKTPNINEDWQMGTCMQKINASWIDTRDEFDRARFLPLSPPRQLGPIGVIAKKDEWIHEYSAFPFQQGTNCCSEYAITFHYIDGQMMYAMEYMLYHYRVYGIEFNDKIDDKSKNEDSFLKTKLFAFNRMSSNERKNYEAANKF